MTRIHFLEQSFGLGWMIDQATFATAGLRTLDDRDVLNLLLEMERACECMRDGIPLEDAGFLRDISPHLCVP